MDYVGFCANLIFIQRLLLLPKKQKSRLLPVQEREKNSISETYHSHGGVDRYRTIHAYLARKGYKISRLTVHKYMNTEMQLFSISRKRKPGYEHGVSLTVYEIDLTRSFIHRESIRNGVLILPIYL